MHPHHRREPLQPQPCHDQLQEQNNAKASTHLHGQRCLTGVRLQSVAGWWLADHQAVETEVEAHLPHNIDDVMQVAQHDSDSYHRNNSKTWKQVQCPVQHTSQQGKIWGHSWHIRHLRHVSDDDLSCDCRVAHTHYFQHDAPRIHPLPRRMHQEEIREGEEGHEVQEMLGGVQCAEVLVARLPRVDPKRLQVHPPSLSRHLDTHEDNGSPEKAHYGAVLAKTRWKRRDERGHGSVPDLGTPNCRDYVAQGQGIVGFQDSKVTVSIRHFSCTV
jgi:hypothetical protein